MLKRLKLQNQPVAYERLAKAGIYVLVGFTIVHWSEPQIALILALVDNALGILVWNSVTPNAKVAEQVAAASDAGRASGLADVASLVPEPAPPAPPAPVVDTAPPAVAVPLEPEPAVRQAPARRASTTAKKAAATKKAAAKRRTR